MKEQTNTTEELFNKALKKKLDVKDLENHENENAIKDIKELKEE